MRRLPCLILTLLLGGACSQSPPPPDWILYGGAIYTMDASRRKVQAMALRQGKIVRVGTDGEVRSLAAPGTRQTDLGERMVLPGFHDSHVHLVTGGLELGQCNLNGLETEEEILEAISRYVKTHPEEDWILGGGWDLPVFPDANPHRSLLDQLVPDRPVYLTAADGHSAWVNSRALQVAGISDETADPPGGRIERDPVSGEPTGTLREAAMGLVARQIPPPSRESLEEGLGRALELAHGFGITAVVEANGDRPIQEAYLARDRAGDLNLRVLISQSLEQAGGLSSLEEYRRRQASAQGTRVRLGAVKIFLDGVIESHTAALLEPYTDRPGERGEPLFSPQELAELVPALDRLGLQIHFHAIGDRAVRMALDSLERARLENGWSGLRHHIAHLQLINPDDIPRFNRLGVIANFQPLWAYPDPYITELTLPRLGPARSRWLYPMGSVARSGATLVAGSDWSVSSMNPLLAIQVALTRRDPRRSQGEAWIPEERMNLTDMLAAYTINGAFLSGLEKETGSLEEGKWADFIVLEEDLFQVPPGRIGQVRVLLTVLEGTILYAHPAFSG